MKKYLSIISIALIAILTFTACGAPKSLEEYVNKDSETKMQIEDMAGDTEGLSIEIKENTIYYTYDISGVSASLTEEIALSDEMKKTLETQIDGSAATFSNFCLQLESETKLSDVKMVVTYTYKDKEITTREFTSQDY